MIELQPHQQRVIAEAKELRERLSKLMAFGETAAFEALPDSEQELLREQSEIMADYHAILEARVRGFHGMKKYTCHKQVYARPMTRLAYNELRGWLLPANENGDDAGFLIEYIGGGPANHPDYSGYISWSPKDVFENGYKEKTK